VANLEYTGDIIRDAVATGPLGDGLHSHKQPEPLPIIGVPLCLLEDGPMRDRCQVRGLLAHLCINSLKLLNDTWIIGILPTQARQSLQSGLMKLFRSEVSRAFGTNVGQTECDTDRDESNSLNKAVLSSSD
jgi:hypothetical protein